jgi:hypothetical protein
MKRHNQQSRWLKGLILGAIAWAGALAFAGNGLRLGEPVYGGSGCNPGTASVVLSPEETSLTILFNDFVVEAGGVNSNIARKNCDIVLPITIPQGYSYSIVEVDYRGYVFLPAGASADFTASYFFADSPRQVSSRTSFRGATDRDYVISNRLGVEAIVWSRCGVDTNMRIKATMQTRSNRWGDETLATVDSVDISSGIIYQLQWRRC